MGENKPIDFSDFAWPELSTYSMKDNNLCQPILKDSNEACSILQNNKAGIKNIYFGFMSHILKDYKFGPTNPLLRNSESDSESNNPSSYEPTSTLQTIIDKFEEVEVEDSDTKS